MNKTAYKFFILLIACLFFLFLQNTFQFIETDSTEQKYIGCTGLLGGLGNQIWRIASLYGLGRYTNRKIFFENFAFKEKWPGYGYVNLTEITTIFPLLKDKIDVKNPFFNIKRNIPFAQNCCKYDSPEPLQTFTEKYIQIDAEYLQSYKYFHPYQDDIRKLFEFSPKIMETVNEYSERLFQKDESFKLCIHIRRGDFLKMILLETKEEFVIPAMEYAFNHINKDQQKNISLVFMGNDIEFVKALNFQADNYKKIYYPQLNDRSEEMCFGINYCDAMLLSASGSTFGWWMAYLMKSNGPIFYNSQITDYGNHSKDIYDIDAFLPNWIMLTEKDGKVERETKWWQERNINATNGSK